MDKDKNMVDLGEAILMREHCAILKAELLRQRKATFAWFIDDCQWGPRAMQDDNPRAEVPSVEDLESEWRSDHGDS